MCGCGGTTGRIALPSGLTARCSCAPVQMVTSKKDESCAATISIPARMAPTVARLRSKFDALGGNNIYRVFMVWTRWDGRERGAGSEREFLRVELVPVPDVPDLTAISLELRSAGTLPVGSLRLGRIYHSLTADILLGSRVPDQGFFDHVDSCGRPASYAGGRGVPVGLGGLTAMEAAQFNAGLVAPEIAGRIPQSISFFYEIMESNSSVKPKRMKFRPSTEPWKERGSSTWSIGLEKISEDRTRDGRSQIGRNHQDDD